MMMTMTMTMTMPVALAQEPTELQVEPAWWWQVILKDHYIEHQLKLVDTKIWLRAPTSSWRPFRPFDYVLCVLREESRILRIRIVQYLKDIIFSRNTGDWNIFTAGLSTAGTDMSCWRSLLYSRSDFVHAGSGRIWMDVDCRYMCPSRNGCGHWYRFGSKSGRDSNWDGTGIKFCLLIIPYPPPNWQNGYGLKNGRGRKAIDIFISNDLTSPKIVCPCFLPFLICWIMIVCYM